MIKERGIIIHSQDCNEYWAKRLKKSTLNIVGVHPEGGIEAHKSMELAIKMLETKEWAAFASSLEKANIGIEYEMHAVSWMLDRELFNKNPEMFRMDENNNRTPEFNLCVSNKNALEHIKERSSFLAKIFKPTTNKYYFWVDDVATAACHCSECCKYTPSEQVMIITNAIAEGLESTNPLAKQSFLAYYATLETPQKIKPRKNIFLEFAPMARTFDVPLYDESSKKNISQIKNLKNLLDCFGTSDAKVLDYWMDNSMFSGWKLPPKEFSLQAETMRKDVKYYKSLGFESITSFGCFLGENYAELYGDADIDTYADILYNT